MYLYGYEGVNSGFNNFDEYLKKSNKLKMTVKFSSVVKDR